MPKNHIKRLCPHCGSSNVMKDAVAAWDEEAQEWTLAGVHDHETCQDCEREGDDMSFPDEGVFAIRTGLTGREHGRRHAGRFTTYEAAELAAEAERKPGVWACVEQLEGEDA